jgi:hypothetical protein
VLVGSQQLQCCLSIPKRGGARLRERAATGFALTEETKFVISTEERVEKSLLFRNSGGISPFRSSLAAGRDDTLALDFKPHVASTIVAPASD